MTPKGGALSRWAKALSASGIDRGDVVYGCGTLLVGGGVGWATAPAWGLVAAGGALLASCVMQVAAAAVLSVRKGGGD